MQDRVLAAARKRSQMTKDFKIVTIGHDFCVADSVWQLRRLHGAVHAFRALLRLRRTQSLLCHASGEPFFSLLTAI